MTPWIQVYSNLPEHDKTYSLATKLKIPQAHAVGLMVCLWLWVSVNATDGDITNYPPAAIADAAKWKKNPKDLYQTLLDVHLIEKDGDKVFIRNWEQYALLLMDLMEDQKRKTNERVQKHRAKKKAAAQKAADRSESAGTQGAPCNVTETLQTRDVTPLHNQTKPNLTLPDQTYPNPTEENNLVVVDGYARAEREIENVENAVENYALENMSMDVYFGMSDTVKKTVAVLTDKIFKKCALRSKATDTDRYKVFLHTAERTYGEDHVWTISFPEERINLLLYAFEQAVAANCPGNWKYIEGVLARLWQREIKTLAQAHEYDDERIMGH